MISCLVLITVYLISSLICTGWFNARSKDEFGLFYDKEEFGKMIIFGFLYGLLGPLGVLLCYLLTGFAESGWDLSMKDKEK